jgi:hypothetical protein
MKLFECQNCGQLLYFENTLCESCGRRLGYLSAQETVSALRDSGDAWIALAQPAGRYRYCVNAEHDACNWLVRADQPEIFCAACRHNRMIPDLSIPENILHWRKIELAKHRLFYTLLKLRLPLASRIDDPEGGLAFDFIATHEGHGHIPVFTGHANGLITINIAEADDPERERRRSEMGEPYRTLLGHFRHEIAHYYWDRLVFDSANLAEFRRIFGDERQDYAVALQNHYANGPPMDWPERFVSAYASSHPWEDFAETWAHYFHMIDTLETANAFAVSVRPTGSKGSTLAARINFDPHDAEMNRIIDAWMPLAFAVNAINRSMGLPDLYPFVLGQGAIGKLAFVNRLIHTQEHRSAVDPAIRSAETSIGA